MKVSKKNNVSVMSPDHADEVVGQLLLMEALGTTELSIPILDFSTTRQCRDEKGSGERGLNFMLSMVKGIEPKDQVEAMLAAQMAVVHTATMTYARRLTRVEKSATGQCGTGLKQARSHLHLADGDA